MDQLRASPSSTLDHKSQTEQRELCQRPLRLSYLWDFPPSAIVRVSREAGGVVGAAGCRGGADPGGRGDASVPAGLAEFQEFKASPFRILPEEARLGGELGREDGAKRTDS